MVTPKIKSALVEKSKLTLSTLYTYNKWLAIGYALQAIAVLVLSKAREMPVEAAYRAQDALASGDAGSQVYTTASRFVFDVPVTYLAVTLLFVGMIAHGLFAFGLRKSYEREVGIGRSTLRWTAHATLSSLIVLMAALLSGVQDVVLLLAVTGSIVVSNLLCIVVERGGITSRRLAYGSIVLASLLPWLCIGFYLLSAIIFNGSTPSYVYGIFVVGLLASATPLCIQWFASRAMSRRQDYLYNERVYMLAVFLLCSAFVWQIFAGFLRP